MASHPGALFTLLVDETLFFPFQNARNLSQEKFENQGEIGNRNRVCSVNTRGRRAGHIVLKNERGPSAESGEIELLAT